MGKARDWTGQKFGRLTFVRTSDKVIKKGNITWELVCECANVVYHVPYRVVGGDVSSCGCLRRETSKQNGLAARTYDPIISSARKVWRTGYKDDNLSFEEFYTLSQLPCDYCGSLPSNVLNVGTSKLHNRREVSPYQLQSGNFTYNGLDRVDPTKGHTLDNCVPCYAPCNYAKWDYTRDEFIAHIEKMYAGTRKYRQQ
jgi:hypothetical protein